MSPSRHLPVDRPRTRLQTTCLHADCGIWQSTLDLHIFQPSESRPSRVDLPMLVLSWTEGCTAPFRKLLATNEPCQAAVGDVAPMPSMTRLFSLLQELRTETTKVFDILFGDDPSQDQTWVRTGLRADHPQNRCGIEFRRMIANQDKVETPAFH